MKNIRETLIKAGVKNLQDFGYPAANSENILTDMVYGECFLSMLRDNKLNLNTSNAKKINAEIDTLINEVTDNLAVLQ